MHEEGTGSHHEVLLVLDSQLQRRSNLRRRIEQELMRVFGIVSRHDVRPKDRAARTDRDEAHHGAEPEMPSRVHQAIPCCSRAGGIARQ